MSALERLGLKDRDLAVNGSCSERQDKTKDTYSFKWAKRDTYESEAVKSRHKEWLFEKYLQNDPGRLRRWLSGGRKIILDAGCGSGFSAFLFFWRLFEES